MVAALPGAGGGAFEDFGRSGRTSDEARLAGGKPHFGQALQVTFGFQHCGGLFARFDGFGISPALLSLDFRP